MAKKDFMSTQTGGVGETIQAENPVVQAPAPNIEIKQPTEPPVKEVQSPVVQSTMMDAPQVLPTENVIAPIVEATDKGIKKPVNEDIGNIDWYSGEQVDSALNTTLKQIQDIPITQEEAWNGFVTSYIPDNEHELPNEVDIDNTPLDQSSLMDIPKEKEPEVDFESPVLPMNLGEGVSFHTPKTLPVDPVVNNTTDKYRDAGYDIQSDLYGNVKAVKKPVVKVEEKIYSFPGREDMEYTVQSGDWKIRKKGTDEWQTIKETARIKALNKEHGLAVSTNIRQGDDEIFTGESGKKYRLDYTGNVPVWKKYTSTSLAGESTYDTDIIDPKTVNLLNKKFRQQASTSSQEHIYTGFPNKEENQYRESEGHWQRKQPNTTEWTTITDKVATEALNKQFKKDVAYSAGRDKYAKYTTDVAVDEKKALNEELKTINSSLIGKGTSEVKSILKEQFGDNGFEFYGGGSLVDEIKVVAPNGKYIRISLDNINDEDDLSESINLKSFIEINSNKELNKAKEELDKTKDLTTESGFDVELGYADRFGNQAETKVTFTSPQEAYKNKLIQKESREKYIQQNAKQVIDVYEMYRESMKVDSNISDKEVTAAYANLPHDTEQVKIANDYTNDILHASNAIKNEIDDLSLFVKDIHSKLESGAISEADYNANYKKQIADKSAELQAESKTIQSQYQNLTNINKSIDKSVADNYIIQESKGTIVGGIGYKFTKGLTSVARLGVNLTGGSMSSKDHDDLVRAIVGHGTTEEYMNSEKRGDLSKTLFSLSESIGALAATAIIPGGGIGKAGLLTQAGRVALVKQIPSHVPFYALGYYEMKDELDKIEGMTEAEKVLMSSFYGVGSSVLEKYGLNKAMSKTPIGSNLKNNVLGAVFKDIPKNASKEVIESLIDKSIKKKLVASGVTTTEAMTVGGLTEMSQSGLQMGIKEVYDQAKGTSFFNNESGLELVGQVLKEGYLGVLGSGIMHTISQAPTILTHGIRNTLNEEQIKVIDTVINSPETLEALTANVKVRVASGEISKKEGESIIESYKVVKANLDTVPNDLPIEAKAEALDLVLEKQQIQEEIVGKDEALIGDKVERVKEINVELSEIAKKPKTYRTGVPSATGRVDKIKTESNDTENKGGVSSKVRTEKKSVKTKPNTETSVEKVETSGDVQAHEEKVKIEKSKLESMKVPETETVFDPIDDFESIGKMKNPIEQRKAIKEFNSKHGNSYNRVKQINTKFDDIIKQMESSNIIKKEC